MWARLTFLRHREKERATTWKRSHFNRNDIIVKPRDWILRCEYLWSIIISYNETALRVFFLVIHFIVHRITYASNLACLYLIFSTYSPCHWRRREVRSKEKSLHKWRVQRKNTFEPNKDKIYSYCSGVGACIQYSALRMQWTANIILHIKHEYMWDEDVGLAQIEWHEWQRKGASFECFHLFHVFFTRSTYSFSVPLIRSSVCILCWEATLS